MSEIINQTLQIETDVPRDAIQLIQSRRCG